MMRPLKEEKCCQTCFFLLLEGSLFLLSYLELFSIHSQNKIAKAYSSQLDPWVGKIPWRRAWQPTPVFLPGESRGQRSLVGCSPWDRRESDVPKRLSMPTRGWDTALEVSFLPQCRASSERLSPDYPASSSPGPSTDTLSSFYTSCPPTQQNARETATMVLILFVFQRELFGLLIRSVFQRGLFGLSQFD